MAPSRLTSWVFRVASAGAIAEIYVRRPLSPGSLHLLHVTRAPGLLRPSAEVLTQETDLLLLLLLTMMMMRVRRSGGGDVRSLGAIGDWTEVPPLSRWRPLRWAEEVGTSDNSVKVQNQECSQASAQLPVQGRSTTPPQPPITTRLTLFFQLPLSIFPSVWVGGRGILCVCGSSSGQHRSK